MTTTALNPNEWLDTQDLAAEYGMSVETARRLLKEPTAPVLPVGGRRKVRRGEFETWLRNRSLRGAGTAS